jgi:hypothetical protein
MTISARLPQVQAYRQAERELDDLFAALIEQISGILLGAADSDGNIAFARSDELRQRVRRIVEQRFVARRRLDPGALEIERQHVQELLDLTRAALKAAPARSQTRLRGRTRLLAQRLALLATGIGLVSLNNGIPATPYARIVLAATRRAATGPVEAHAGMMVRALSSADNVTAWLRTAQQANGAFARRLPLYDSVLGWRDTRGYVLSDRIWGVSQSTLSRIDVLLEDGIAQGRSAVALARDVESFLNPSRRGVRTMKPYPAPYGTDGSFDARRLARTEITRAHTVSAHLAGVSNPFVTRTRYHTSKSHDPGNCDGTCDEHYAQDQEQGGFEPGSEPLPVIDTHPQCLCYITHETGPIAPIVERLRGQLDGQLPAQSVPITPLATQLMIGLIMGVATYAYAGRQTAGISEE